METQKKKLIIAGASGLVGSAALERFGVLPDWDVIAISRRKPFVPLGNATHLSVDLLDRAASAEIFGAMPDVNYVMFAALTEREDDLAGGWRDPDQIAKNEAMLVNLFDPLISVAKDFRHISILHGGKAYGVHIPGYQAVQPMYEDAPRHPGENFYYRQHDYIAAKQQAAAWSWTIFRPGPIFGISVGANLNPLIPLVIFAALCKETGRDLPMPAGQGTLTEPSSAEFIAEALQWAAETPAARNEIFNLNNGDLLSREIMFPTLARCMGIKLGAPISYSLTQEITNLSSLWPTMVEKYSLNAPKDLNELFGTSLQIADQWTADMPPDRILIGGYSSNIKIRQAGFSTCVDNRVMLEKCIRRLQALKMIPS